MALTLAGACGCRHGDGYYAVRAGARRRCTAIVGVGLNVLLGLTGQVSLGHVGFYAIGAYVVGVLTLQGVSFWLALPAAAPSPAWSARCSPCRRMRVRGPYLAMVTIAFGFIVEHVTIEWRGG